MIVPNREVNGNFTLFLDDEKLAGITHLTLYFLEIFRKLLIYKKKII